MKQDASYYADKLVEEFKKPESERTFFAEDIPEKYRKEVADLLNGITTAKETPKPNVESKDDKRETIFKALAIAGTLLAAPAAVSLLKNPFIRKMAVNTALGIMGGKAVDKITEKVSNKKYGSFGEYVYKASGLEALTKGTVLEGGARFIADSLNPGFYLGIGTKPLVSKSVKAAETVNKKVSETINKSPQFIRIKHSRQDANAALDDVINYTNVKPASEPKIFTLAKSTGQKTNTRGVDVYKIKNGYYMDYTDRPYFKTIDDTAAIYKVGSNTYSFRLSPQKGQTLPFGSRKQVAEWIDGLPHHSYISGDYSALPQGQVYTTMLDENKILPFIGNYILPSKSVRLTYSGLSPDAFEYVAKLAQRPGYKLRYTAEPMLAFNPLGAHGQNEAIYNGWISSLQGTSRQKQEFLNEQLNPWLKDLGLDRQAYLYKDMIMIPHPVAYKVQLGGKIKKAE